VSLAVAYALRFFHRFRTGLLAISDGGYDARLDAMGPPEFVDLAQGFNHMAARLEAFSQSNQRLERQIHSVQEEERAGIARDLHDEVGPYLFAIQVDANVAAKSQDSEIRKLGGAIREAALHIQNHVKEILRQLRPVSSLDFGLEPAIADLAAFWSRRHPEIRFERAIAATPGLDRQGEDVAYRIVQESISNAVRHGKPQKIQIIVSDEPNQVAISVVDDGGGLNQNESAAMSLGHNGLAGMRERLRALGGRLTIEETKGHGVCIRAFLPKIRKLEIA
jgi:two-component system sensor histidine kinase UhpB